VGVRDGLQNEKMLVSVGDRIEFIKRLSQSGLAHIEAAAFVSPKWVPQMSGAQEIFIHLSTLSPSNTIYSALVPNLKGYESAVKSGCKTVAVFTAASESFNRKNINASIQESIDRFEPIMERAKKDGISVRGYVSCVVGCPYEGRIDPTKVAHVAHQLYDMGCYEVSLGDTIGVGTPGTTSTMIESVAKRVPLEKLAVHYHDTYGQALANILKAVQLGIRVVDSSVAGLGGCPYAKGATGNVATEDVVYMLSGMGYETGVDLNSLVKTGDWISKLLGRQNQSRTATALLAQQK
jgi:hydroxymethylglutaryl-CoA lyase